MGVITNLSRAIFAKQLAEDFQNEIAGNIERVVNETPEEKFFVGKLVSINDETSSNNTDISSKTFASSISMDFYIKESDIDNAVLNICPRGDLYYRVYPSLEEQRGEILKQTKKSFGLEYVTYDSLLAAYEENLVKDININLIPVFKRLKLEKNKFIASIKLTDTIDKKTNYGIINGSDEINHCFASYIEDLQNEMKDELDIYRAEVKEKISIHSLKDEITYSNFINDKMKKDVLINQNWKFEIEVIIKKIKMQYLVSVSLINNSATFSSAKGKKNKQTDKPTIETLFNSGIDVSLEGANFDAIVLEYFKDDYKYDRKQVALGTNCSIVFEENSNTVKTDNIPKYIQKRLITNDLLAVKFIDLVVNPIETLNKIKSEMDKELKKWKVDADKKYPDLSDKGKEALNKEIREFELEIKRYAYGVDIIRNYPIVLKCFILMNQAFLESSKKFDTWRLFQIVFIVSVLPDIVACDENVLPEYEKEKTFLETVSLLYFPTGGGKTEAFLGVLVFNLFFDRFRGKYCGVTSILRYPLRLLSVQQVQRLANLLAKAELIRRADSNICNTEGFTLGYFTGDRNTANKITIEDVRQYKYKTQEQMDEDRVLDICPFCGQPNVHLKFDDDTYRLVHICENSDCSSGGFLPIFIVDTEIYRYLPSAIISTVDKLAILGNNRNFRNILNGATKFCPKHGYTSLDTCIEKDICDIEVNKFQNVDMYDPSPTLFIQDELHLIRESLGTYASHYESFLNYYIKKLSKSKRGIKIIGATATISSYEDQILQLYNKDPQRFPVASPYLDHNFYSLIDKNDTQRIIMGYVPYGRAIISSVAYSIKYMRIVVDRYLKNPKLVLDIGEIGIDNEDDALKMIEDYWIFLEYNNVKRDSNNVEGALETPINVELAEEGIMPFITRKMTGDESFQDVREVLAEVENSTDVYNGINLIAATSMISHGVDADRFNLMFFFGIPGNTAEYIQAYSRTGRKFPSIVVDLMRPSRETDQSYLKNFNKFHEYKDILVEAVPINRWATKAIDNTISGIFMGLLLNYYDVELQYTVGNMFFMKNIKKAIFSNKIEKDQIKTHLMMIYGCIDGDVEIDRGKQYAIKIDFIIDDLFVKIVDRNWTKENIFDGFNTMGYRIMNSLRDTDEQLIVELE